MKLFFAVCLCAAAAVCAAVPSYALEVEMDNRLGVTTLTEEYGSVDSEWVAFFYKNLFSVGHYPDEGFIGGVNVGVAVTPDTNEDWKLSGENVATNDLRYWGIENSFEVGYVLPIFVDKTPFAPIMGYGWSFTRLKRSGFDIPGNTLSSESTEEDLWVHHVDAGFRLKHSTHNEKLKVNLRGIFGFIVAASSYNSANETKIDGGNGSFLIETDLKADYFVDENLIFNFGGFVGIQHLEGSTKNSIVWPDTDLNTYGGSIGLKYVF
ncbi:MAG: hypothetical protein ABIJ27_01570 [Candidatus Omnitrophota bacterium]